MAIKQVKLDVNEVTIGMFVSGLDRPWTQTPFPLQGFYVRDLEEIRTLKAHCRHVYIDVVKGAAPLPARLQRLSSKPDSSSSNPKATAAATAAATKESVRGRPEQATVMVPPIMVRTDVYGAPQISAARELASARTLHREVYSAVSTVMTQIASDHQTVPAAETKRTASAMVDSVLRSPDAFTWLSRVRAKDEYTYSHAVRSAVWGILFGRHIGLPKSELDVLAMGILMKDIGKTRIPKTVLEKAERTPVEQEAYQKFVNYGVEILERTPDIKPRVTAVVKTHRERLNGSGFPDRLRGDRIPLLGKIAGIVTYYDETTHPRGHRPLSPSKAVSKLYELRNVEFQADLVVEFIKAIGLYPTGTLVALNTGEVAVVVEQNFRRRLRPKVMVVTDAYKRPLDKPILIDLAAEEAARQAKIDAGKLAPSSGDRVEIVQDLEPDVIDVNVAKVMQEFMDKGAPKGGLKGLLQRLRGGGNESDEE